MLRLLRRLITSLGTAQRRQPAPNGGARRLDVTSPATPAGAVQHGDLVAHLGPHDGARQWEASIVVGGEGCLGQESAGAGCRAGAGELAQVAAVAGEEDDVDVVVRRPDRVPDESPTAPVRTIRLTARRGMETCGRPSAPSTMRRFWLTWTRAPSRPT